MSDFSETWSLVRGRLIRDLEGLTHEQLNWRLHPGVLTLAELAVHVAGVEVSFGSQLTGLELDDLHLRLKAAATDGSVNDKPFPFSPDELTPEFVTKAFELGNAIIQPLIENPTPEIRAVQIVSALGPVIDGTGAFARLAYHPGYHQGQVYIIKTAPGFPS